MKMNKDALSAWIALSIVASFIAGLVFVELNIHTWWACLIGLWGFGSLLLILGGAMIFFLSLIVRVALGD